jgi:arylsulfatase A-like enzyme
MSAAARGAAVIGALAFSARAQEAPPPAKPEPARRNVLLVTLDTTRRDFMGFLGRTPSPTPNLDALAAKSVVFEDAVTTAPLTLPAHASLLTGLYPVAHGIHDNSLYRLPEEARTLAEILRDAGFATRAAVAAFVLDPVFGLDQGFERYLAPPRGLSTTRSLTFTERSAKEMVDLALADLAELAAPAAGRSAPRPFLYWLHLFDPHSPYRPERRPPESELPTGNPLARSRMLYAAEIAGMDAELGRLLAGLDSLGLAERTLVVVAADHGEGLGDGREATHGHFLFDPVVRVPLIVRDARLAPARVATPVSLVDVAPTLLARLGVAAPEEIGARFDGLDLSPWMVDPALPPPDRVLALESWYVWLHYGWAPFEGATCGPLKLVRSHGRELFDRASDRDEAKNLFAPDDERARSLERRLVQAQRRSTENAPAAGAAAPGLSAADLQALQALGYATGGGSGAPPAGDWSELPDAYGKLDVIRGFDDVANAIEREQFDLALTLLRELAAKEPRSSLFHEQLGLMLINLDSKNADEAAAALKRSLELDPRSARAWFGLGRCGIVRRDAARAELKRRRDAGETSGLKPLVQAEREQAGVAEQALRECLRLEPSYPEGLLMLARVLFDEAERATRQHEADRARSLYQEVEKLAQRLEEAVPPDSAEAAEARKARSVARSRY